MDSAGLEDDKLGFRAKGVLAYLLSKPSGWHIRIEDLVKRSTDGRHSIYAAIKQLRRQGYMEIVKLRGEDGHLMGQMLKVYELPSLRFSESRESRASENQSPSNKEKTISKKDSTAHKAQVVASNGSFDLEEPIPAPRKYSSAVETWAHFSVKQKYHLKGSVLAKGAQRGGWTRQTLGYWEHCYQSLLQCTNAKTIEAVVQWYIKNFHDEWLPVVHTFPRFCERFEQIQRAMKRQTQPRRRYDDEPEEPKVGVIVERYRRVKGKFVRCED